MDYEVADTVGELKEILENLPEDAKLEMCVGGECVDTIWVTHKKEAELVSFWVS